jgi:hypothetical protein
MEGKRVGGLKGGRGDRSRKGGRRVGRLMRKREGEGRREEGQVEANH